MPNGHGPKEYGEHKYADHDGRTDYEYSCGCWVSSSMSGGPIGLDPFGTCPGNPHDGKLLGGKSDYEHVVKDRIEKLEARARKAEDKLKKVSPSKNKLALELIKTQGERDNANRIINEIRGKVMIPS